MKLRSKMLLLSLSLLMVPWVGYQQIKKTETFLRAEQSNHLQSITKTIAALLKNKTQFFQHALQPNPLNIIPLYAPHIRYPLHTDGYFTDWEEQSFHQLQLQHAYFQHSEYKTGSHGLQLSLASQGDALHLFVKVTDTSVVYHQVGKNPLLSDHIKLNWLNAEQQTKSYILYTAAPGRVYAKEVEIQKRSVKFLDIEHQIQSEWQQTTDGYQLEIQIPRNLLQDSFALNVMNIDAQYPDEIFSILGTSGAESVAALSQLIYPSEEIEDLLASLTPLKTKIWVVDSNRTVLAQYGELKTASLQVNESDLSISRILRDVYRRVISTTESYQDPYQGVVILNTHEVDSALANNPVVARIDYAGRNRLIATHPITDKQAQVMGAVVAERSNYDILILQNSGIEELINKTLLIFSSVIVLIFLFASRLSFRIQKLKTATEKAISSDGRIHPTAFPKGSDELGELSQTFHQMLTRLEQYNDYLETMAANLAHEIRTPVAIVKSSLEHLELAAHEQNSVYVQRAKGGIERLTYILNSISEATRLEQCLAQTEKTQFSLCAVLEGCYQGYKTAYPQRIFTLKLDCDLPCQLYGSGESIAQALDKLIENAVEFSPEHSRIVLQLSQMGTDFQLRVQNQGPLLPKQMREELFHSMVSIRDTKTDKPHLGLGLYMVRLICEHHGGTVSAENLSDHSGVVFCLLLPFR